ncbi:six-cysteine peptide SCIFF [Biomaibacter acetigenes]|uniref:Six-cysteine peptide SCIFF n=1 Tax=Biomaibacter acetigenes TaxID=2316383 RepID=A0A3G2R5D8_9FIRM|nr:six-cysteine ranthipeptide SCIFF [Biomaibacter acetigenes]AYO30754.1 six-cysteine peptide SCIFF [Biomaibacter acetigenes]RKL64276.1 six-cysteine peptide SCIFF [Thermoanaerobacteraceae bacterium SP2]
MRHIVTIHKGNLNCSESVGKKGCGECQSSCQSACKTSCTVANQVCQKDK